MEIKTKPCNTKNFGGIRTCTDYIVVHFTSNLGDTAQNNAAYFAREAVGASAHFFVDEGTVWNSVPLDRIAWHCGAKSYKHRACRNTNSIGVEICMNAKNGRIRQGSIDRAAVLVRELMDRYRITADHILRHYDVTGKDCPAPMVAQPKMWADFLDKLKEDRKMLQYDEWKEYMARYLTERDAGSASAYAKESIARMQARGVTDGARPQAFATREEVLAMLDRALIQ